MLLGTFTIALGAALSSAVDIPNVANYEKVALVLPAAWTAADLKFQVSLDGGTTKIDLTDAALAVLKITSIPTARSVVAYAPLDAGGKDLIAAILRMFPNAKFYVVSINTGTGADENQVAARTIKMVAVDPALSLLGRPADGGNVA